MTKAPEIPRQERLQVTAADGTTHRFYTHDEVQAYVAAAIMGATVKPLEWRRDDRDDGVPEWVAVSYTGRYEIRYSRFGYTAKIVFPKKEGTQWGYFGSDSEAKLTVQQHHQKSILSALSIPTDAMAALEAVKAQVLNSAVEKLTALIIERQNDKRRARVDFNRGAVDALHEAKAAIRAMKGGE